MGLFICQFFRLLLNIFLVALILPVGLVVFLLFLLFFLALFVSRRRSAFQVLEMTLRQVVGELLLLDVGDRVDVLELSLPIPVLIEQVIVAAQLLSHLSNQRQVLLRSEASDENV